MFSRVKFNILRFCQSSVFCPVPKPLLESVRGYTYVPSPFRAGFGLTIKGYILSWLAAFFRGCPRGAKRPIGIPVLKPVSKSIATNTKIPTPLYNGFCNSLMGYKVVIPSISEVFRNSGPFTILREIPLVIVNAVELVLGSWFWTHVFNKVFVRFLPASTNLYASPSVVMERPVFRIITSGSHASPCKIERWIGALFHTKLTNIETINYQIKGVLRWHS